MINFIQPYSYSLNIGKAYNDAIEPLQGWIVVTDQDTLKFEGFANRVREIVNNADKSDVITCMTNRLAKTNENLVPSLYEESDVNAHCNVFNELWELNGATLEETKMPIAGVFMLFHKSTWDAVKFNENSIRFDIEFTDAVRKTGRKTKVATGLYIFHLYRWGRNVNDIRHLKK